MGGTSIWHWLVVGIIVLLLFGRGKISEMMGDVAKGIKAFKKGMTEDEAAKADAAADPKTINHAADAAKPVDPVKPAATAEKSST